MDINAWSLDSSKHCSSLVFISSSVLFSLLHLSLSPLKLKVRNPAKSKKSNKKATFYFRCGEQSPRCLLEVFKKHEITTEKIVVGLTERDLTFLEFPVGHRVLQSSVQSKKGSKYKKIGLRREHVATAPNIGTHNHIKFKARSIQPSMSAERSQTRWVPASKTLTACE